MKYSSSGFFLFFTCFFILLSLLLVWRTITDTFDYLPLAVVLDNRVFCVHGGLGKKEGDTTDPVSIDEVCFDYFHSFPFPHDAADSWHGSKARDTSCWANLRFSLVWSCRGHWPTGVADQLTWSRVHVWAKGDSESIFQSPSSFNFLMFYFSFCTKINAILLSDRINSSWLAFNTNITSPWWPCGLLPIIATGISSLRHFLFNNWNLPELGTLRPSWNSMNSWTELSKHLMKLMRYISLFTFLVG